jgi:hypothetical protein
MKDYPKTKIDPKIIKNEGKVSTNNNVNFNFNSPPPNVG